MRIHVISRVLSLFFFVGICAHQESVHAQVELPWLTPEYINSYYYPLVAEFRGFPYEPSRPINVNVLTRDQLQYYFDQCNAKAFKHKDYGDLWPIYQDLFSLWEIISPKDNFQTIFESFMKGEVFAFYDPDKKRLTIPNQFPSFENLKVAIDDTISHEVVHALTYRHRKIQFPDPSSDTNLAHQTLYEADATLTSVLIAFGKTIEQIGIETIDTESKRVIDLIKSRLPTPNSDIEKMLLRWFYFPYIHGLNFVRELLMNQREASWAPLNAAYDNPPISTSQILHPLEYKKYLKENVKIQEIPEQAIQEFLPKKAKIKFSSTLGEFFWLNLLMTKGFEEAEAQHEVEGWKQDRWWLISLKDGQSVFVSLTSWDSIGKAQAFSNIWNQTIKLSSPIPIQVYPSNQTVLLAISDQTLAPEVVTKLKKFSQHETLGTQ